MAKLPSFQRLSKEDFPPESQLIIEKVGTSLNSFAELVLNAFNKNITVEDNLNMEYKTVDVTVNGSGIPSITLQFISTLKGTRIRGVSVIKVENLTISDTSDPTYISTSPFILYTENNKLVTITQIKGLTSASKYRLTLLVYG